MNKLLCFFFVGVAALGVFLKLLFVWDVANTPELNIFLPHHDDFIAYAAASELGKPDPIPMNLPLYPAYAYFLHGIFKVFGTELYPVFATQALLGIVSSVLLGLTGALLFGTTAGWIAALLFLFYKMSFFYDITLLTTALAQFLIVAVFYLFVSNQAKPSLWKQGAFLLLGLSLCLMRIFFWGLFLAGIVQLFVSQKQWKSKSHWAMLALFGWLTGTLFFGAHSPESYRSKFGIICYRGNNPSANGLLMSVPGVPASAEGHAKEATIRAYELCDDKSKVDEYWMSQVWAWMRSHPLDFARLQWKKIQFLVNDYEILDTDSVYYYEKKTVLGKLPTFSFGVLFALAIVGMGFALARRKWGILFLTMAVVLVMILSVFICSRYRMPWIPFLVLFAGHGVMQFLDSVRNRRFLHIFSAVLGFYGAFLWSNRPLPELNRAKDLMAMEHLESRKIRYAEQKKKTLGMYQHWKNLPKQQAIPALLNLASLHCYHEFFSVCDDVLKQSERDPKTVMRVLQQKALLLETLFRIPEAIEIWEKLKLSKEIKTLAEKKIQDLRICEKYLISSPSGTPDKSAG